MRRDFDTRRFDRPREEPRFPRAPQGEPREVFVRREPQAEGTQPPHEEPRNALRAAIAAAVPEPAAASAKQERSPAEILREKLAHKQPPQRQESHVHLHVHERQKTSAPAAPPTPAHEKRVAPAPKEERSGEISKEELERVLRGGD